MFSKISNIVTQLEIDEITPVEAIEKSIEDESIFSFVELLEHKMIKNLCEDETKKNNFELLKLFCYGNYSDYLSQKDKYPILTEVKMKKLRQLTIISLTMCSEVISYDDFYSALYCNNMQELEALLIDLIFLNIIDGYIDQEFQKFHVKSSIGRDVPKDKISEIKEKLQNWSTKCNVVKDKLKQEFNVANSHKASYRMEQQQNAANVKKLREEISQTLKKDVASTSKLIVSSSSVFDSSAGNVHLDLLDSNVALYGDSSSKSASSNSTGTSMKGLLRNLKKKT